jgi:hypothetical protein
MIFCNCKKGCGSNQTCKTCSGDNCENSAPTMDQEENEDEDENPDVENTPDEDDTHSD